MLGFLLKNLKRTLSASIIAALILIPTINHTVQASGKKPTKFEEINSWKRIGNSWAAGYNSAGQLLGIYDLSFPTFLDSIELGFLDFSKENYERLYSLLSKTRKNPAISSTESESLDTVLSQLDELKTDPSFPLVQNGTVLQDNWWKEIPWNSSIQIQENSAPEAFLLSDINYRALVSDKEKLDKQMAALGNNFLDQFKFVKNGNKGYKIFWIPPRTGLHSDLSKVTQPRIITDFTCIKCGMAEGLTIQGISSALGGLVGMIPVPVIAGLLNVAITEYFTFYRELLMSHYQMALEVIQTVEENPNAKIPFATFSKEEREAALNYLIYAESELFTALQWVKKKPLQVWNEAKTSATHQARDSIKYLEKQGTTLDFLNPRFAFGVNSNHKRSIYSLSTFRYWNAVPPFVAVDYAQPATIYTERVVIEAVHILVTFLRSQIPIPGVGTIAAQIYEAAIESQMHAVQHWESRLSAHLNLRSTQGESWMNELTALELQQVNPFEIPPEKSSLLIQLREKAYRIPPYMITQ